MDLTALDKAISELEFRRNPQLADELRELRKQLIYAYHLPCHVGDTVYALRQWHGTWVVHPGIVSEMVFQNGENDMELVIAVRGICRSLWGDRVFGTQEEAERALERRQKAWTVKNSTS